MFGVNLSGAEFGRGDRYGFDYAYPGAVDLDYYQSKGVELIRLPFKWDRMQATPGGELNTAELARMKEFLVAAEARGMKVIVDLHNYGRYGSKLLGSNELPSSVLADFWGKLAQELKGFRALAGYDLMNEPHGLPGGPATWASAAQLAVDAIRKVDMTHEIHVEGYGWATASQWVKNNPNLKITDPANNIVYQAHLYFDANNSGTYKGSYDAEGANAMTGVQRLQPFFDWLKANNARGFIGEFNAPDSDPRWIVVLDNAMKAMQANGVSGTLWGGGSWWRDDYMMNLRDGMADSAQMKVLNTYLTPPKDAAIVGTKRDDKITGTAGDDRILAHGGADTLTGGAGADTLIGGAGADTFLFGNQSDSTAARPDVITDLSARDIIDLSRIDANSRLTGDQAFTLVPTMIKGGGNMTMTYDPVKRQTGVRLDIDGDAQADMYIVLSGDQRAFKGFIF